MSARDAVLVGMQADISPPWTKTMRADAILSALSTAGLVIEQDWQPIATAPRNKEDNTKFLLLAPTGETLLGRWFQWDCMEDGWWVPDGGIRVEPTHWRPLPAAIRAIKETT